MLKHNTRIYAAIAADNSEKSPGLRTRHKSLTLRLPTPFTGWPGRRLHKPIIKILRLGRAVLFNVVTSCLSFPEFDSQP
ncbi:hypothetical protein RRG08_019881 [Elysia crispata]|uniref:Uncharacterized protein n=1 Tax=Elysia crispata TaxID=231223 RepID=A0AAE0Z8E7_9GAST|nr:hypothetical protein RRG08_019881 [Elysia crispata]